MTNGNGNSGDGNGDDDCAGSGRSPKPGQFRKGKSGNPRGRPRKAVVTGLELIPALFPTRAITRADGAGKVTITDASGRHPMSRTEAVSRAQFSKAMGGRVDAQRDYLTRQLAEDERYHREQKERFDYLLKFRERRYAEIAAGRENSDLLPHPDDMLFNFDTLEVTFVGATDPESRAREKKAEALKALAFEMSHYLEEGYQPGRRQDEADQQLGAFMLMHILAHITLPPRLRRFPTEDDCEAIYLRATHGKKAWGDDLERRCREADAPFIRWRRGVQMRTISQTSLNKQWGSVLAKAGPARP